MRVPRIIFYLSLAALVPAISVGAVFYFGTLDLPPDKETLRSISITQSALYAGTISLASALITLVARHLFRGWDTLGKIAAFSLGLFVPSFLLFKFLISYLPGNSPETGSMAVGFSLVAGFLSVFACGLPGAIFGSFAATQSARASGSPH